MNRFAALLLIFTGLVAISLSNPTSIQSSVDQIKTDIATMASNAQSAATALDAFSNPGGTIIQAMTIQSRTQTLINSVNAGTLDAKNLVGTVLESDGRSVLDSLEALEPLIFSSLNEAVEKKPAFDALSILGVGASTLVLQGLTQLAAAVSAFETALLVVAPADLVTEAVERRTDVDNAFAVAIAAYTPLR